MEFWSAAVVPQRSRACDRALQPALVELSDSSSHDRGPYGVGKALEFGASQMVPFNPQGRAFGRVLLHAQRGAGRDQKADLRRSVKSNGRSAQANETSRISRKVRHPLNVFFSRWL